MDPKLLQRFRWTYVAALAALALVCVIGLSGLGRRAEQVEAMPGKLRMVARQAAIAQSIALDASELLLPGRQGGEAGAGARERLELDLQLLHESQRWLGLHLRDFSQGHRQLLGQLGIRVRGVGDVAHRIRSGESTDLRELIAVAREVEPAADQLLAALQSGALDELQSLRSAIDGLLVVLLACLVLEGLLLFEPLRSTLRARVARERELADQATEELRIRADFLSSLSHEVRAPLDGVVGLNELLCETQLDSLQRSYLHASRHCATNARQLVEEMVELVRGDGSELAVEPRPLMLRQLVEDAVAAALPALDEVCAELVVELDDKLPAWILGDPGRLLQLVRTLVSTALRGSREGSVHLRLCEEDSQLRIEVEQVGVSYLERDGRERILELGQSIVDRLVEAQGGRLAAPLEGAGDSLRALYLPLTASGQEAEASPVLSLAGIPVAVVDDNAGSRRAIERDLEAHGARVASFASGAELLAWMTEEERGLGLVLTDDEMPDMDGPELIAVLRQMQPHLPVVLLRTSDHGDRSTCPVVMATARKPLRRETLGGILCAAFPDLMVDDVLDPQREVHHGQLSGLRVLCAEPGDASRQVLAAHLDGLGCTHRIVGHGQELLEAAIEGAYDVVLIACSMPGIDGHETTLRLRSLAGYDQAPVIGVSNGATDEDRELSRSAGIDDHLPRPYRRDSLHDVLLAWADRRHVDARSASRSTSEAPVGKLVG